MKTKISQAKDQNQNKDAEIQKPKNRFQNMENKLSKSKYRTKIWKQKFRKQKYGNKNKKIIQTKNIKIKIQIPKYGHTLLQHCAHKKLNIQLCGRIAILYGI